MQYKNKRTVLLYMLVFLLTSLIGILNSEHPLFNNFSGIFYGGIIVIWAMTVLRRIIEPQIKGLLIENAALLLMLILFHALRYQFAQGQGTVHRFMWYCYYIPICYIPVISFKLCLRCGVSENVKINPLWDLAFLPSMAFSILILTNDRHNLAFSFPDPVYKGYDVFEHGPVYFAAIVWISALIIATVVITIIRFSSKPVRKDSWVYYVVLTVSAYFLLSDYFDFAPVINDIQYLTPIETFSIFIVCGWEACIQTCLLPSNSGYKYFFENSGLIAKITDNNGVIRIASKGSDNDWGNMHEDYHIIEKEVWGGTLNYAEDISAIMTANRELEAILATLKEENSIQEAENALQEERVHVSVMNRLYDDITEFSSDKTEEIEGLLNSSGDEASFRVNLEKACVLASYIKRRGNLYLLGEENHIFDFNDIYLSFKESLDYFSLSGAKTLLTTDTITFPGRTLPKSQTILTADTISDTGRSLQKNQTILTADAISDTGRSLQKNETFLVADTIADTGRALQKNETLLVADTIADTGRVLLKNGSNSAQTHALEGMVSRNTGLLAYDCLEAFLERFIGRIKNLLVNIHSQENLAFRLMFDSDFTKNELGNIIIKIQEQFCEAKIEPLINDETCCITVEFADPPKQEYKTSPTTREVNV